MNAADKSSKQIDMSVNSSTNSSSSHQSHDTLMEKECTYTFMALFIVYILLLPLFILVLYVGYQRWRKQRSVATAPMTSHSDVFTFHMVVLELITILGFSFYCYGAYSNELGVILYGVYFLSFISPGQTLFHLLTCVDRYLAVVHPVTYLRLRQAGGVRIRNVSIGCVWLVSLGSLSLTVFIVHFYLLFILLVLSFSFVVVCFCSLSVLCVLIRPGPGEVGGNRRQVDQSKQRAFHTMTAITGALLLRFLTLLVSSALYYSAMMSSDDMCLKGWSMSWFSLPSSLVLPLLFLHRAGKLPGCERNTASA